MVNSNKELSEMDLNNTIGGVSPSYVNECFEGTLHGDYEQRFIHELEVLALGDTNKAKWSSLTNEGRAYIRQFHDHLATRQLCDLIYTNNQPNEFYNLYMEYINDKGCSPGMWKKDYPNQVISQFYE